MRSPFLLLSVFALGIALAPELAWAATTQVKVPPTEVKCPPNPSPGKYLNYRQRKKDPKTGSKKDACAWELAKVVSCKSVKKIPYDLKSKTGADQCVKSTDSSILNKSDSRFTACKAESGAKSAKIVKDYSVADFKNETKQDMCVSYYEKAPPTCVTGYQLEEREGTDRCVFKSR